MNYRIVLYTLGLVLNCEAVCLLLPLICAIIYGEAPLINNFLICIGLCLFFGSALAFKVPKYKTMYSKEGFVSVALSWILISIFGSFPFILSGYIPNFFDALFETASGFTTTGASIIQDVEVLPKSLLFWRSFTHWIGGMGILVFLVALMPISGGNNLHLLKAESPGPTVSKFVPKVKSTAKILYGIYIFMTILEIIFLMIGKMSLYESFLTAFGTAGTGGFGFKNSGFADYSPYIQNVITIFMALFGINFTVYYLMLIKKFRPALSSRELRAYVGILIAAITIIFFNCRGLFTTAEETLRHAAFQVSSIMTTTGYSTTDFDKWPQLSKTVLLTIMFIGACAGSTGGGIKVSRILILLKSVVKEVKLVAHPKITHKITLDHRMVEHETVRSINVYMVSYIVIMAFSILIISIDEFDFSTNFSAVTATLNNIGPGFSLVGPARNYALFSTFSKFVLTMDMLIGRLEIFPILILFSPYTWKR
ncbi:MAG: TrkH family potassium uptake protein [Monoglobales bacterium]